MPTFVIYSLGEEPRTASFDTKAVRVGREEGADLVLSGRGVSRDHALVYTTDDGRWMIFCASQTNPLVVDGAILRGDAELTEGSEILVGTDTLLLFAQTPAKARTLMGDRGHYAPSRCGVCGWSGMISVLRKEPVCPSCTSVDLKRLDTWSREEALEEAEGDDATEMLDKAELKASLKKLRTAKRSRLERIDGREGGPITRDLVETERLVLSGGRDSAFPLAGLVIGEGVEIAWNGGRYIAHSHLTWPALKINGAKTKRAPLDDGDVLEIGSNRFKMQTL